MIRIAAGASVTLLALALVAPKATAENPQIDTALGKNVQVGYGVVCDTRNQVEQFAKLSERDGNVANAINAVNTEAKNPAACAQVVAAFIRGQNVGEVHRAKDSLAVAEITILAVPQGNQWQFVSPVKQYTAFPVKGYEI